jgi:2-polyprenyl-6-hydroxyphenyl methylase/3-demethylubiquinone-9 3-methyltransferase
MTTNADPQELEKFGALAHRWWDPDGEFAPLHRINPLRLGWISDRVSLKGTTVVDVGCGGGILAESMALRGARVKGIDLSDKALAVARLHNLETRADTGVEVEYESIAVEALAAREPSSYDVVSCMELLEHVPSPESTVAACAALVRPGGHLFFSTINRNPKSYLFAVIGAEYILKLLPKGTHDYSRFLKPAELARMCRDAGLEVRETTGLTYNPATRIYSLKSGDTDVNYLLYAVKP